MLLLRKGGQTVYFGDLGQNTTTLISYFEKNGSRKCLPDENPYVTLRNVISPFDLHASAEFMLDVIGAGATAMSEQNWYDIWRASPESEHLQQEIESIHSEGRNRPAVKATFHSEFATSWLYQTGQLLKRDAEAHWRDPTYLMAKLVLNSVGGLFLGFTFFNSKDSQQGTQNKLFVCTHHSMFYFYLTLSFPGNIYDDYFEVLAIFFVPTRHTDIF